MTGAEFLAEIRSLNGRDFDRSPVAAAHAETAAPTDARVLDVTPSASAPPSPIAPSSEELSHRQAEPEALKWAFFWEQVVAAKSKGRKLSVARSIFNEHFGEWPPWSWSEQIETDASLQERVAADAQARAASPTTPTPPVDLRITGVPADWYGSAPPQREWLLREASTGRGVLPRGKVGTFLAPGAGGKTMALCQLAVAIASGTTWLGSWMPNGPGRVLLVLAEEDDDEVRRRLYYAARVAGVTPPDGSIEVAAMTGVDCALLARSETGDPVETPYLAALRERITREGYTLVVLDPLARFSGGEAESSNAWATRLIAAVESIATASGATVLVAHHTPQWSRIKSGDVGGRQKAAMRPDAIMSRGVTALTDGPRWVAALTVERIDEENDGDPSDPGIAVVTIALAKTNYGPIEIAPIICQRDGEHGGALVPMNEEGLAWLQAAMQKDKEAQAGKATKPMRERAQVRQELKMERLRKEEENRQRRQADAAREEADRCTREDATARAILDEFGSGVSYRDWQAEMRARLGKCSTDRADAARARVSKRPGGSK